MTSYHTVNYNYASRISQLRGCQLIAFVFQAIVLYLESDRVGLLSFLVPLALLLLGVYVVGSRWFYCIDGRFDFRQVLYVHDGQLKLIYAFHLFGGFMLALLVHFVSPVIHAGLHSIVYNLANFLSVFAGFVCLGFEVFESLRS